MPFSLFLRGMQRVYVFIGKSALWCRWAVKNPCEDAGLAFSLYRLSLWITNKEPDAWGCPRQEPHAISHWQNMGPLPGNLPWKGTLRAERMVCSICAHSGCFSPGVTSNEGAPMRWLRGSSPGLFLIDRKDAWIRLVPMSAARWLLLRARAHGGSWSIKMHPISVQ